VAVAGALVFHWSNLAQVPPVDELGQAQALPRALDPLNSGLSCPFLRNRVEESRELWKTEISELIESECSLALIFSIKIFNLLQVLLECPPLSFVFFLTLIIS